MRRLKMKKKLGYSLITIFVFVVIFIFYNLNLTKNTASYVKIPTVFCIILTSPYTKDRKILAVHETWAKHCDKYFFIKKLTLDVKNASIEDYTRYPALEPAYLGNEVYKELTNKVYLTLVDVYKRYGKYDWYLKADDDTFIFMDHLKQFLMGKNQSALLTYGYNLLDSSGGNYRSGGAGYVLSNGALQAIGAKLSEKNNFCVNSGTEDADVGNCLSKLNVTVGSSVDEYGRERFHPFSVSTHIHGVYPAWVYLMAENPVKTGRESISETTISFHYVTVKEMKKLYELWQKYKSLKENDSKDVIFTSIFYEALFE